MEFDGVGLTEEDVSKALPFLRGFYVFPLAWKQFDDDAAQTLGKWMRQGTHLRRLVVEPKRVSMVGGKVRVELTAGLEGGLALPLDIGQIWTGFDGYVMVVHLGLLVPEGPAPCGEVRVQLGAAMGGASSSLSVIPDAERSFFALRGFDLTVTPKDDDPPLRGRLLRQLDVAWRPPMGLAEATYSNEGADSHGYTATVRFPYSAVEVERVVLDGDADGEDLADIRVG